MSASMALWRLLAFMIPLDVLESAVHVIIVSALERV